MSVVMFVAECSPQGCSSPQLPPSISDQEEFPSQPLGFLYTPLELKTKLVSASQRSFQPEGEQEEVEGVC